MFIFAAEIRILLCVKRVFFYHDEKPLGKVIILLIFSSIVCMCCQSNPERAKLGDIITIDISKNYPRPKKNDQVFFDVEYVPLETNKDVLVDSEHAILKYISEQYIVVTTYGNRREIFIFNRNGKNISVLNHNGRGPEEYTAMRDVVFDEKNEEIFVFDNIGTGRILVYSITGEYKRTLKHSTDLFLTMAYEFDEETILVYDTKGLYDNTYSKKPYMFMSKKDGSIISTLNISLPVRYGNKVFHQFKDLSGQSWSYTSSISIPNRRHYGQEFVISDVSSDTIYWLTKNRDLIPFIVRTPSVHSTDPHLTCTTPFITDKYIFFHITTLDYVSLQKEMAPPAKVLMYGFETGEISTVNSMFDSELHTLQKNIDAELLDVTFLKDAYEKGKFGKLDFTLKQLVPTLDEEDNPVVMIMKYK